VVAKEDIRMGFIITQTKKRIKSTHNHKEEKEEQSLNIKAVYLETLSDTIGAAGVLVAGLIMTFTDFYLADPIISIGLALFILPRTWSIIKKGNPHTDARVTIQYFA
jgi:Co/Zn/Cd efflux system component